jgi:hypothetical protein
MEKGAYDRAIADYTRAVNLASDNTDARTALDRLQGR